MPVDKLEVGHFPENVLKLGNGAESNGPFFATTDDADGKNGCDDVLSVNLIHDFTPSLLSQSFSSLLSLGLAANAESGGACNASPGEAQELRWAA